MSKVTDILNFPSEWPASFPQPAVRTRVITYIFSQKDDAKVEKLLNFIKDNAVKAKVSVIKDKNGYTSVSITQVEDSSGSLNAESAATTISDYNFSDAINATNEVVNG